ncbi:MAG TPA: MFS transporter, partial [Terriglobales bacterium]|nr:MFS transporter [Terriglobales bacterium]
GLALAAASVLCLALPFGIFEMTALRGLAGVGQGVLMIGVQSYILAVISPEKKTQGTAIIVFGFQGGLLSGMALGSLLFSSLHASGVFVISGCIGLFAVIYTFAFVARSEAKQTQSGIKTAVKKLASELKQVMTNFEFLKTLLCIGAPAKAILTGVISFALPLILGQLGYRPEDIGQVIMLYGLGVLASSGYISRYVDRTNNSELVLFLGAVMSGLGLMAIGFMNSSVLGNGTLCTIVAIVGVSVVGIAHGFINAPVVSHVGHSALAKRIGANPAMTAYRFVERGGHVSGPLLVSQFFLIWGQGPVVIGGIGLATALLGLVFLNPRAIVRQIRPRVVPAE